MACVLRRPSQGHMALLSYILTHILKFYISYIISILNRFLLLHGLAGKSSAMLQWTLAVHMKEFTYSKIVHSLHNFYFKQVTLTPWVGGKVQGDAAVDIGFARGGIRLIGYLLETKFPITIELVFSKYPLDLG